jgi:hypothetical protein
MLVWKLSTKSSKNKSKKKKPMQGPKEKEFGRPKSLILTV